MPHELCFTCPLPNGLHARPASQLAEVAAPFAAQIELINQRSGSVANAKSVLSIVAAAIKQGDGCCLRIAGVDADAAMAAIWRFIQQTLPGCDEPMAVPLAPDARGTLPRILRKGVLEFYAGTAVSRGIGQGAAVVMGALRLPAELAHPPVMDAQQEQEKISNAVAAVRAGLEAKLAEPLPTVEGGILKAHLAIVSDVSLAEKLRELIAGGLSAGQAVVQGGEFFISQLRAAESLYIRERALDMQDICLHLLEQVYGEKFKPADVQLTQPSVLFAENLTPRQFLSLDRPWLKGLVLRHAGTTSHTVILARSLGIPTLTGVSDAQCRVVSEQPVIVDGDGGIIITAITPAVSRYYQQEQDKLARRQLRLAEHCRRDAVTADGQRLEVAANVATAQEVAAAFEIGAEGIGVFRTEMLFMDRPQPPSEDEQYAVYRQAAIAAGQRGVIIRTIDFGGDKPLPYLNLPKEANPFLGYRGVRIYPQFKELFETQLRAIVRASGDGDIRIMAPMVTTLEEVRWVKARLAEIQAVFKTQGVAHNPAMPIGIMIEVPSVAFIIDQFSREVDFFSIGSNDLAQYFLAADRDSPHVAAIYNPRHPAFLRILKRIVDDVHAQGKWVGLCGEMGADIQNLPLMVGLGLDEISGAAGNIAAIKAAMVHFNSADCRAVLDAAMAADSVAEVDGLLAGFRGGSAARPLLDAEMILVDCDGQSKEEAIKQIIDGFYVAGRTDAPRQVEDAVWAREEQYSTGLGYGFAIPHCKTDAMSANSIGIARLKGSIDWGSVDGQPVSMVILLAVRASDKEGSHLKIFAKLARKLMHEEFRDRLMAAGDGQTILAYLKSELEVS